MVMVKVPEGTRRLPRDKEHPPNEWTIMLDLHAAGLGEGEVEIGYTERRGRTWRAFPAHAVTWQDHRKWVAAVEWLVQAYKSHLNTSEPAAGAEGQHVAQQSQATLEGGASLEGGGGAAAAPATEAFLAGEPADPASLLGEALGQEMDWLTTPAKPAPESAEEDMPWRAGGVLPGE
jgi:hypothetical protein